MRSEALHYGPHRAQIGEIWRPTATTGDVPVVVLIHGGYWRALFTKRLMHPLAKAVVAEGWIAWNVEYRRLGSLGGGGGWPHTFVDVAAAVDFAGTITGADRQRVATVGHSAGGQLALWAASRPGLPPGAPGSGPGLALRASVSLAGVVDLEEGARLGLGNGAVAAFLGGDPDSRAERYQLASPAARLALGVPHALIHGSADTVVPPAMSERYAARARAVGDDVILVPLPGATHRDLIAPRSGAWLPIRDYLRRAFSQ